MSRALRASDGNSFRYAYPLDRVDTGAAAAAGCLVAELYRNRLLIFMFVLARLVTFVRGLAGAAS